MIRYPLRFLPSLEEMAFESATSIADDPKYSKLFREYRSSITTDTRDLPWLNMDRAFFVATNKVPGDDLAIALDYRTSATNPRVVASEWTDDGVLWCPVAATFTEFVDLIDL
ncbi:hypothetical protein [Rubripirellula obstinata]|nr:hypothetical protein [Rubripirellula obstinata]